MAVVYDHSTTSTFGAVSSESFSFTASGNTDEFLWVVIGALDTAARTVTGVTFNSVALTQLRRELRNNNWVEVWYLAGPDSGAHTLAATFSASVSHGGAMGCMEFNGVDQTTPLGTAFGANAVNTAPSVTVTGTAGSDNLVASGVCIQDDVPTEGALQTRRFTTHRGGDEVVLGSTEPGNGGSVVMSYSLGGNNAWGVVAAEILESSGAAATSLAFRQFPLRGLIGR